MSYTLRSKNDDGSGRVPRYYQVTAVNRTVEAVARGQDRILLVMATGTGKTYTAFQIIWRLQGDIGLHYLRQRAPFLAREIERAGNPVRIRQNL